MMLRFTGTSAVLALLLLSMARDVSAQETNRAITIKGGTGTGDKAPPIDLTARFDRDDPVYAVGARMTITITTSRAAAIRLWEIYPGGEINYIGGGACFATAARVPLIFPAPGQHITVSKPFGVTELHVQALDPSRSNAACHAATGTRSLGDAANRIAWRSQMREVVLRYTVVRH